MTRWQDAHSASRAPDMLLLLFGNIIGDEGTVEQEGAQESPLQTTTLRVIPPQLYYLYVLPGTPFRL